jgi:hypothetical protein
MTAPISVTRSTLTVLFSILRRASIQPNRAGELGGFKKRVLWEDFSDCSGCAYWDEWVVVRKN